MTRYDFAYYRHLYTTGGASLDDLSQLPNAPKLDTLKKRSAAEDWPSQRKLFKHQTSTKAQQAASTTEVEVAARHVGIARALQDKALKRLETLKLEELTASEVRQFLKDAAQIERDALGLNQKATLNIKAEVAHVDEDPERARLARAAADALEREWEHGPALN